MMIKESFYFIYRLLKYWHCITWYAKFFIICKYTLDKHWLIWYNFISTQRL